jgi:hypothetical protein
MEQQLAGRMMQVATGCLIHACMVSCLHLVCQLAWAISGVQLIQMAAGSLQ